MKITKKNQTEDKHKLTQVNKTVTIICQTIDGIKQDCPEKNEQTNDLKNHIFLTTEKLSKLENSANRHQQYSQHNCILIHRVQEGHDANTAQLVLETVRKSWKLSGYQILIERAGLGQRKETTKRSRKKIG